MESVCVSLCGVDETDGRCAGRCSSPALGEKKKTPFTVFTLLQKQTPCPLVSPNKDGNSRFL